MHNFVPVEGQSGRRKFDQSNERHKGKKKDEIARYQKKKTEIKRKSNQKMYLYTQENIYF